MDQPYVATVHPEMRSVVVTGTLDETSTPRFRTEVLAVVDAADGPVTIELSDVDYLLSVAVAAMAAAMRHGEDTGTPVRLHARAGTIAARVLEICGLPYDQTPATPEAEGAASTP